MLASSREIAMYQTLELPDVVGWQEFLEITSRKLTARNVTRLASHVEEQHLIYHHHHLIYHQYHWDCLEFPV